MEQQNYPISEGTTIVIRTDKDLEVRGWDRPEVSVQSNPDKTRVQQEEQNLMISCGDDAEIQVPATSTVKIKLAGGDAQIDGVTGIAEIDRIGGDLQVNHAGAISVSVIGGDADFTDLAGDLAIGTVGADLNVQHSKGVNIGHIGGDLDVQQAQSVQVGNVGGDFTGRDLSQLKVGNVGGDLSVGDTQSASVENVGGDVELQVGTAEGNVRAGGDLTVQLGSTTGGELRLKAGGDVNLYLPKEAGAQLEIHAGSQDISLELAGQSELIEQGNFTRVIGQGGTKITISAGGDVRVSDQTEEEIGKGFAQHKHRWHHGPEKTQWFAGHAARLSEEIQQQVNQAVRQAGQQVQQAIQQAEQQARQAVEQATSGWTDGIPPAPPAPAAPKVEPVPPVETGVDNPERTSRISEEERVTILSMLQQKKITVDEAEKLLEALEGKYGSD